MLVSDSDFDILCHPNLFNDIIKGGNLFIEGVIFRDRTTANKFTSTVYKCHS